MFQRFQRADVIAAAVIAALAGGVGTGLGLAAANVRAKDGPRPGPLRVFPGYNNNDEVPVIPHDRFRRLR